MMMIYAFGTVFVGLTAQVIATGIYEDYKYWKDKK